MRYAVVLGIILVAIPLLMRLHTPEPFADAKSYETLRESQIDDYDSLYAQTHHKSITDVIFSVLPPQLILVLLATITLLAMSFYYDSEIFILLFASSPVFLTTFTRVGDAAIGATLMALGAVLIKRKQYWAVLIIPVCFSLSFSIGMIATITIIAVALINSMPFVALGASFFALLSGVVTALLFNPLTAGLNSPSIGELLGLFGTTNSVTIFLIFLGLIGFILHYTQERRVEQLVSLAIIPCAVFFELGSLLIAAFLSLYGSRAWDYLYNRKWNFEELRTVTLTLIACGILLTCIGVERELIKVDQNRVEAVRFVSAAYPQGTSIVGPKDIAPLLAYEGYPSYVEELPSDPTAIGILTRQNSYNLIITKQAYPGLHNYPLVYADAGHYYVYDVQQNV